MKYIADTIMGYVLMSRDIEIEIDEAKLEAAFKKEAYNESGWEEPTDEWWIDVYNFADLLEFDDDEIEKKGDAIVKEWEALPDCGKVRDVTYNYMDRESVRIAICKRWLKSKGWTPLPEDDTVWFHKK